MSSTPSKQSSLLSSNSHTDSELALLFNLGHWIDHQLDLRDWSYQPGQMLQPLSGDAGFRRYFRVDATPPLLAVYAPPASEDSTSFIALARFLREQGVHAPEVVAADIEQGFLLVEDFGDQLLLGLLNEDTADLLYGEVMMTLLRMQQSPAANYALGNRDRKSLPCYDQQRLRAEMELLREWFIPQLLGYQLTTAENALLDRVFTVLEQSALEQTQVLVHRDYHSRNIIVRDGEAPGVIDFQDAVIGPVTYDLVSLLRDCYIRWPQAQVQQWALAYGNMALEVGLIPFVDQQKFLRWFDLMGLQRHIKVLGIFARLWLRDGKAGYLRDLPLVIRYVLDVADEHVELSEFSAWFRAVLLPLAETQSWYHDYRQAGER